MCICMRAHFCVNSYCVSFLFGWGDRQHGFLPRNCEDNWNLRKLFWFLILGVPSHQLDNEDLLCLNFPNIHVNASALSLGEKHNNVYALLLI